MYTKEISERFFEYIKCLGGKVSSHDKYDDVKLVEYRKATFLISTNENRICFSVYTADKRKIKKFLKLLSKYFKEKPTTETDDVNKITSFIFSN